jgi:hypothetical protein
MCSNISTENYNLCNGFFLEILLETTQNIMYQRTIHVEIFFHP